jgi:hypothetical protein
VYWVIIIALAVLLIMSWSKDSNPGNNGTGAVIQEQAVVETVQEQEQAEEETPVEEPTQEAEETCSDGIQNQDETDVDCGGSCGSCADGLSCNSENDCASDYCLDGTCAEEPAASDLSGEFEVELINVRSEELGDSGAKRVTRIEYELRNGLAEDVDGIQVKVYLKSTQDSTYCLNQAQGDEYECADPYVIFDTAGVASGAERKETKTLEGLYLGGRSIVLNAGSSSMYENGDSFDTFIYVYDDNGREIDGEPISDRKTVK